MTPMAETILFVHFDPQDELRVRELMGSMGEANVHSLAGTDALLALLQSLPPDRAPNLVLVGPESVDPVQLAQRIQAIDRDLSIVLVSSQDRSGALMRSIQFAPFLGPNVQVASEPQDLREKIASSLTTTHQRRHYKRLLAQAGGFQPHPLHASQTELAPLLLERLLDQAPIGVLLLNDAYEILSLNRTGSLQLGVTEREAVGESFIQIANADDEASFSKFLSSGSGSGSASGAAGRVVIQRQHKGASQSLELTLTAIRGRDELEGKLVLIQDITSRLKTELDLRRSEQRFRDLAEAMPQLSWTTTADGSPDYANGRCIDYTGYDIAEKKGTGWAKALHPDDTEKTFSLWSQAVETGSVFEAEYRLRSKTGSYRWFLGRAVPMRNETGEITSWVGTATDIEERKQAEAILRNARARLEEEVAKRTDALRESNIVLQATNEELEAFCYSVSHDLRAPLRGIDGFSQALLEDYGDRLDEAGHQYLNFVRDGIQRMGRLIDDLLNLSRLTRAELKRLPVDLSTLARQTINLLRSETPGRDVQFNCQDGLTTSGDPVLLAAVLDNLLANAWKYTSKIEHARIEFGSKTEEGKDVYFVRDNGVGFNMAYYDKLFGAFQRLHSQKDFPGTGVGLATVRRIILRHGGRIWAEAEVGKGATFYFTLGSYTGLPAETLGENP